MVAIFSTKAMHNRPHTGHDCPDSSESGSSGSDDLTDPDTTQGPRPRSTAPPLARVPEQPAGRSRCRLLEYDHAKAA